MLLYSVQSVSLLVLQQSGKVPVWKSLCVKEDWGGFFGFVLGLFWARTLRETVGVISHLAERLQTDISK